MLLGIFKALWTQFLVFAAILAMCSGIVWLANGRSAAEALLQTSVLQMKGPWVWMFGFGLAFFVNRWGPKLAVDLDGVLVPNETTALTMDKIKQSADHRKAWRYTLPVTLLGGFLTAVYGIPNSGVARYIIFSGVCAIYYIGAYLLFHFTRVIDGFHLLL